MLFVYLKKKQLPSLHLIHSGRVYPMECNTRHAQVALFRGMLDTKTIGSSDHFFVTWNRIFETPLIFPPTFFSLQK